MVKLRLKRYGRKQQVTYRIIAIDAKARREGRALKEIGFYNPRKNETQLNIPVIISLLNQGAQPSNTVYNLFKKAKIFENTKVIS
uniref:Small ribosomal subunit protein bS16c n=1 Tax=Coleochaete scutata TaxID=3125 RepID=A0A191T5Q3_COLSC|nr:ribosomal protein S16 [Coleochaete scutata]ANI25723.1 ribosomal protein S16 [Coleochaete scutata]